MFYENERGGRGRHHGRPEAFAERAHRGVRHYRGRGEGRSQRHGPGPSPWIEGPCLPRSGRDWRRFDRYMGRGPVVRRGDVRAAILVLLAEQPMHGYEVIGQLGERSGGIWRPSAGSVYPTLQQLEDEGLVKGQESEGRRVYALTDTGKTAAAEAAKNPAPWDIPGAPEAADLRDLIFQVGLAASQVSHAGTAQSVESARAILTNARRSLYRLLAEDDQPEAAPAK